MKRIVDTTICLSQFKSRYIFLTRRGKTQTNRSKTTPPEKNVLRHRDELQKGAFHLLRVAERIVAHDEVEAGPRVRAILHDGLCVCARERAREREKRIRKRDHTPTQSRNRHQQHDLMNVNAQGRTQME